MFSKCACTGHKIFWSSYIILTVNKSIIKSITQHAKHILCYPSTWTKIQFDDKYQQKRRFHFSFSIPNNLNFMQIIHLPVWIEILRSMMHGTGDNNNNNRTKKQQLQFRYLYLPSFDIDSIGMMGGEAHVSFFIEEKCLRIFYNKYGDNIFFW